ncbi:MAG: B12-binding domain-containing radical SAM protein [Deltaproteobacteria bacterium]|nr:B12-binding domain-containing radical SAM protein [Deltaproteobacteria bacterium]
MAKVLLVKAAGGPPYQITPPLGLLYVASAARKAGHDVRFADLRLKGGQKDMARLIKNFRPDVVGISAVYPEMGFLWETAGEVKRQTRGRALVVAGGPCASTAPEEVLSRPDMDFALVGEGEETFPALLDAVDQGFTPKDLPGLAFRWKEKVRANPAPDFMENLDVLPRPAWDLVDFSRYEKALRTHMLKPRRYAAVMTSRGCPFGCIYCHKILGKKFRPRSPQNVVDEMEHLVARYGVQEIEVWDDVFNVDAKRAEKICDLIIERRLNVRLSMPTNVRADIMPPRLLRKMKDAGLYYMGIAVETGSPEKQKLLGRNFSLEKARQTMELARKLSITTTGFFMLGLPGETAEEMEQTISFACQSPLNFATFNTLRPYPNTVLWDMCGQEVHGKDPKKLLYVNTSDNLSSLPDKEYARVVRSAIRRFYARGFDRILLSGAFRHISLGAAAKEYLLRITPGQRF